MKITTYTKALEYVFRHIPHGVSKEFPGKIGLERMKYLMELLGNPQENFSVIHIAGTSGKGSTAIVLSHLLTASGFKTGLHISPHILDIRERIQIDNSMISKQLFTQYLHDLVPAVEKASASSFGTVTYFELLVALSLYAFAKQHVHYAVIETGMGGLLDGTNVVKNENKMCIVTKIGLDHTQILGDTLAKIASQKAGIIQNNNTVISTWQEKSALTTIQKAAKAKRARLIFLSPKSISNIKLSDKNTAFDFTYKNWKFYHLTTSLLGAFQAENISVALSSCIELGNRDGFMLEERSMRKILKTLRIPARMDLVRAEGKTIIIDGAHNPQKMGQFLSSLKALMNGKKGVFIVAFKKGKDYDQMLAMIIPLAEKIIFSRFSTSTYDLSHFCEDPKELVSICKKMDFSRCTVVENAEKALYEAFQGEGSIVATGSLYFASDMYRAVSSYSSQQGSL